MRPTDSHGPLPMMRQVKRALCAIMMLAMMINLVPCAPTAQAASRSAVVKKKTYLRNKKSTKAKATRTLVKGAKVTVISKSGAWYKIKAGAKVGYALVSKVSLASKKSAKKTAKKKSKPKVVMASWKTSATKNLVRRGKVVRVTDVYSGKSFNVRRVMGHEHMDMEPATKKDTAILKKVYGGHWSWARRPIWINVGGKRYAASMNGMPHGTTQSKAANNYKGVFCVHFKDSRTHGTDKVDAQHQKAVSIAYKRGK